MALWWPQGWSEADWGLRPGGACSLLTLRPIKGEQVTSLPLGVPFSSLPPSTLFFRSWRLHPGVVGTEPRVLCQDPQCVGVGVEGGTCF